MEKKTLLVITPGKKVIRDCVFDILVAETGEHLASHFCSNYSFAYGDLYGNRSERRKEWGERFGEIEVKFLEDTDISQDELLRRNKEWYSKLPSKQKTS